MRGGLARFRRFICRGGLDGGEVTEEGEGHDDAIGMAEGLIQSFIIVGPHGMAGFGAQQ